MSNSKDDLRKIEDHINGGLSDSDFYDLISTKEGLLKYLAVDSEEELFRFIESDRGC